jgi:dienelactone hydrolase
VIKASLPLLYVSLSLWADDPVALSLRGKAQSIVRLQPAASNPHAIVVFLPGDGGWRGAAVTMGRMIMTWGYDVYGFDTKRYLEVFSQNGTKLSQGQLGDDLRALAAQLRGGPAKPVVFVGWSQGAGMAVAAAAGSPAKSPIHGVITLGLPESAVLGWDWKATLAVIARREPDQPAFPVKPLLHGIAPTPVWMIHGSEDEYTSLEAERVLFEAVNEPKRFDAIDGANHRFDGHQDQLYRSLKAGLEWIVGQ